METGIFNRLQATLLAVATAGLFLLAVLNLRQERKFQQPDDGVWWSEAANGGGLVAEKVLANSPGQRSMSGEIPRSSTRVTRCRPTPSCWTTSAVAVTFEGDLIRLRPMRARRPPRLRVTCPVDG